MDYVRKDTNIFRSSYLDQTWNFITIQVWDKTPLPAQNQKGDNILYCSLNTQAHQQLHTKRNTFSMY